METLVNTFRNRLEQVNLAFIRYLTPSINWNNRLFAIVGARGTGKTTLLLQYIKQNSDITVLSYSGSNQILFRKKTNSCRSN